MCDPIVSAEVEKLAAPPDTLAVPSVVAPSLKVTVPVAADGESVAIKVTLVPMVGDAFDVDSVTAVVNCWTVTAIAEDVAAASFVSPP